MSVSFNWTDQQFSLCEHLCVVGGELYNVPSALRLFPDVPAIEGPFGAWTALAVGTIGWGTGLILAVAFFLRRVQDTNPFSGP